MATRPSSLIYLWVPEHSSSECPCLRGSFPWLRWSGGSRRHLLGGLPCSRLCPQPQQTGTHHVADGCGQWVPVPAGELGTPEGLQACSGPRALPCSLDHSFPICEMGTDPSTSSATPWTLGTWEPCYYTHVAISMFLDGETEAQRREGLTQGPKTWTQ